MSFAQFTNLPDLLEAQLHRAERRLQIAVCWFTHRRIFAAVLDRLSHGVAVELVIEYDNQNIRPDALDFEAFLRAGGQLFARPGPGLMHHKFVLIDETLLLTGSFNWTYNVNAENLLVTDEPAVLHAYAAEFARLRSEAVAVTRIDPAAIKAYSAQDVVENAVISQYELRRHVAAGARLWRLRVEAALPACIRWPVRRRGSPCPGDLLLGAVAGHRLTAIGLIETVQPDAISGEMLTVQVRWSRVPGPGQRLALLATASDTPGRINGSALKILSGLDL